MFNQYNTEGYTNDELVSLNNEWLVIVEENDLEIDSDEYTIEYNSFCDVVSKR